MPSELAERSSPRVGRSMGEGTFPETPPFFAAPFRTVVVWAARTAERRRLGELAKEPRLLSDIGPGREQAPRKVHKWRR
jgi:uncharacterized protein YjiS (DUF1127 family)